MNSFDHLNNYLRSLEKRLRMSAWARGLAVLALAALIATLLLVLMTNAYTFSPRSVLASRFMLFLCVAIAVCFGVAIPLLKLNRNRVARRAEQRFPEFQQRLLTFAEMGGDAEQDPFLELLAAETVEVARRAEPYGLVKPALIAGAVSTAAIGLGVLIWLIAAGPGFLGYGSALLWGATPKTGSQPFYDIRVIPGDATVRKGGEQEVRADLTGFQNARARIFAKFANASKWEEAQMLPRESGPGFQFVFAGLTGPVEYYVEAGGLKSRTYKLSVVDLPGVKRMRVTYHYPNWIGLRDVVQQQGGDLRAVEGTEAEIAIETDRPLADGVLVVDGETKIPLERKEGNWLSAKLPMKRDGLYHVAAIDQGKTVRLTEDFFIEVRKETPPTVALKRPARDAKVLPIEEVTVEVRGEDDFALHAMELHYSVNGAPEKTVSLLSSKGVKQADGSTLIALEDYKLVPGDLVAMYATARNARQTSKTDMFFLEAQPYEREYSQSQQSGSQGGEGESAGEQQNKISQRQKEIIAATWNQSKAGDKDRAAAAENAKFLADVQSKLRDQAKSLSERMGRRQLSGANQEFDSFGKDMNAAAEDMGVAAGKLSARNWKDALPAEQRALQHLLRAEATFRQIQVAFGSRNQSGGANGGAARDLENLFDLELDTEKNQYETGQQAAASAEQRQREVDEALQKLEQLARRQQELAAQQAQRQNQLASEQRWRQEMLRREAEELKRQMQQMAQQGQQSSSGQQSATQQRLNQLGSGGDQRIQDALKRMEQATNDMRRAGESPQNQGDTRRAAERLQEARDLVNGLRRQQTTGQLDDLAGRAGELSTRQKDFESRVKKAPGDGSPAAVDQGKKLAGEKDQMISDVKRLEKDMQQTARDLSSSQRTASSKLRQALGDLQQDELALRMKFTAEYLRQGYGQQLAAREAIVSTGLDKLRDQLKAAQSAMDKGAPGKENLEKSLSNLERLRGQAAQGHMQPGDAVRGLSEVRQGLRDDPGAAGEIDRIIRDIQGGGRKVTPNDPLLQERMRSQVLPAIEQLELQLRRKLEDSGQVRSGAGERIPQGYTESVAEYFRRLSKAK